MAVPTGSLTTLTNVKTELGLSSSTDDAYLERLIGAASELAQTVCRRTLYYSTSNITESVAGFGTPFLQLSRAPITAITSISFDGATLNSSNYEVYNANAGLVYSETGWLHTAQYGSGITHFETLGTERKLYSVVYKGGYVTPQQVADDALLTRTLPYDLEDAVIQLVVYRYRMRGRDQSVASESLLNASVSYRAPTDVESLKSLMPQVYDILRGYMWEPIL